MLKNLHARTRGLAIVVGSGVLACVAAWLFARLGSGPAVERATLATVLWIPTWSVLAIVGLAGHRADRAGQPRRNLFGLHRRLGAALTVAAIAVFASGVGAVLDRALASWQVPEISAHPSEPASRQALDEALETLLREHPELHTGQLSLHPASDSQPWIQAGFRDAQGERVRVDLDPESGEILAQGEPPLWVLRELHRRLLLTPQLGEALLGIVGLCLGLVLLSGLATRRWWRASSPKRVRTRRPGAMRMHQWLGVGLLPAATAWAWSGAMLGLTLVIVPIVGSGAYQGDRGALMHDVLAVDRPALIDEPELMPQLRVLAERRCPTLLESVPDATLHRLVIRHPGRASGSVRLDFEGRGLLARGSLTVGSDGSVRDCRALRDAGVGMRGFMGSIALHYGEWGESGVDLQLLVDLVYLILGSALVVLAWLGGELLARRRTREGDSRGALRLRRWLTGVGLGLGLITVELALFSRIPVFARDAESTLMLVGLTGVVIAVHVATGELARRRVQLLLAIAVVLAAIPLVGWMLAQVQPGVIEGLAWIGAAGIGGWCARRRARAEAC